MATKSIKKNSETSTLEILKSKAININQVALKTSHEIVDETIATGSQWQDLMAKTLKNSTILFGKQQDMLLTSLEMLKDRHSYNINRLRRLMTLKSVNSKMPKPATKKPEAAAKTDLNIDQVMEVTASAATKAVNTVKKTVKTVVAETAPVVNAPKKPAAAPSKKAIPSTTAKKESLTLIEGIGPKIEQMLNSAGIIGFAQLATSAPADLKKILESAGNRFAMHDPSTWPAQAKLAAAGKMDELKTLQTELKAGK